MSDQSPILDQINLVTEDFAATLSFYRQLGIEIPDANVFQSGGSTHHANGKSEHGAALDIDSAAFAQIWNTGWKGRTDLSGRILITFRFATRDGVDRRFEELTRAGYRGLQVPYDAFWGSRFGVVEDPNGVAVGLMSPSQDAYRGPVPSI